MGTTILQSNLAALASESSGPLRRYLIRQVGDPAVAEDLLQETWVRAARGLKTFRGDATLDTWVFAIATRVIVDYLRHPLRRIHVVDVDETDEVADADCAVDQRIVIDEMNACIREVIDSLPGDYRAALVLHDLEGRTVAQTAEVCGVSVATAKIRIHRARKRLRQALGGTCDLYRDGESVLRCDRKA